MSFINHLRYTHVEPSVQGILYTVRLSLYPYKQTIYHLVVMSNPIPERQGKGSNPNSRAALVHAQFKPGQSGNPGGMRKGTPRVDAAYCRLLAMTPEELAVWEPANGAEIMASEQFKRACNPQAKQTLTYAQEVTNRTDGPIVRKVEKVDLSALEAERERFECAIGALMDKRGCTRSDAASVLALVNPTYKKFIEVSDNSL